MSTYGVALVADVVDEAAAVRLASQFWSDDFGVDDLDAEPCGDGVRLEIVAPLDLLADREDVFFRGVGPGRAVICEDGDEFGVTFHVWDLDPGNPRCVYRAYVPYDEDSAEEEYVEKVIVGPDAAAEAAELYGVVAGPILALEADPSPVVGELGFIGSPFMPWLDHFGIDWPAG